MCVRPVGRKGGIRRRHLVVADEPVQNFPVSAGGARGSKLSFRLLGKTRVPGLFVMKTGQAVGGLSKDLKAVQL